MNRQQAIETLTKLKPELVKRFGITRLAVFGSTVRNKAKPESDIDILVDFDRPATSKQYFGMQFYLEDILATPVDLVTVKAMRLELRPFIENEAVNV
jgi:predicted nucleotidyltransferase